MKNKLMVDLGEDTWVDVHAVVAVTNGVYTIPIAEVYLKGGGQVQAPGRAQEVIDKFRYALEVDLDAQRELE